MHTTPTLQLSGLPDDASDADLAARAAQGNAQAFALIMRRHNRLLFRTVRSILKSDADTEEALQEGYLSAWRALGTFRQEARLSTWLVRIVINEALGRVRRRAGQVIALDTGQEVGAMDAEAGMEANPDEQPEAAAARTEMRRLMERRIDALPEAFRTVFVLRAVQELSVEEVAAALGLAEATVRTRFFRARGLLRESLSREMDFAMEDAFSFAGARCDRIVAHVLANIAAGAPPIP
ncbi:RNA polymerase subunit sigma [Acidovorax sp. SRB_14]|uniref:RNA polymerase sigma factor n=1 Tax=Acidovorax sp. SRB_14 TaxID=1962699 RepID=UPI0015658937|nr:RNA polymerase sigma factor [Acidovorax sp. SRB_14]NMM79677.1 RNA polymerase subunit sigma [Acidovorax sp. SRB_14]